MIEQLKQALPDAIIQEIFKQGAVAGVLSIIVGAMSWLVITYTLNPLSKDREILLETVVRSVEDRGEVDKRMADTLDKAVRASEETSVASKETASYAKRNYEAQQEFQTTLSDFTRGVNADHPKLQSTADEILTEVTKPNGS